MKTCRRGHVYSSEKRQCPTCAQVSRKAYKKRHPEQTVEYRKNHNDVRNAQSLRYRQGHPKKMKETHGAWKKRNPLYFIWVNMKERCCNPKHESFHNYGGRGIMVCDEWLGEDGYKTFEMDMSPRPSPRHSLDRIDNNQGYSKGNCKWSTASEQVINRRGFTLVTILNISKTKRAWAREIGISDTTFNKRLKAGLDGEKLLKPGKHRIKRNLGFRRRMEEAVITMYKVLCDSEFEGKEEIADLLKEMNVFSVATKTHVD